MPSSPEVGKVLRATGDNVPTEFKRSSHKREQFTLFSVSGPKMYNNTRYPFERLAIGEDTQLYQIVSVDGDTLRFEARTAIGDLYDAFVLKKQPGQINSLQEISPELKNGCAHPFPPIPHRSMP